MTEEEKKAIGNIEEMIESIFKCEDDEEFVCDVYDGSCLKTALNLIQKQDTEINKLNIKNNKMLKDKVYLEEENTKALAKYWNAMKCIDKLNNVIDRMATWIDDHEDPFEDCHENSISCADIDCCKDCIKEYFMNNK